MIYLLGYFYLSLQTLTTDTIIQFVAGLINRDKEVFSIFLFKIKVKKKQKQKQNIKIPSNFTHYSEGQLSHWFPSLFFFFSFLGFFPSYSKIKTRNMTQFLTSRSSQTKQEERREWYNEDKHKLFWGVQGNDTNCLVRVDIRKVF